MRNCHSSTTSAVSKESLNAPGGLKPVTSSGLPVVVAYAIGNGCAAVECPFCGALHIHGGAGEVCLSNCATLEHEIRDYYLLLPSVAAPDWLLEWLAGEWRSPAADALMRFRGARYRFRNREEILDLLATPLSKFPNFQERLAIRLESNDLDIREATHAEIEEWLAATGYQSIYDAAQILMRKLL